MLNTTRGSKRFESCKSSMDQKDEVLYLDEGSLYICQHDGFHVGVGVVVSSSLASHLGKDQGSA